MEDLQATVEIAVDLGKFYNVDLFQRGFYQVAVKLVEPAHPQSKLEVILLNKNDNDYFAPCKKTDDMLGAVSKCVQVLYKRDECRLMHTFLFRVHCLIDSHKIMECLAKLNFQLECILYFSAANDVDDDFLQDMEIVSRRTLTLRIDPIYGLYAYNLVLFEYGYMAAVDLCVHASLVALHQPLMTMPGVRSSNGQLVQGVEPATLESILFRPLPGMSQSQASLFDVRMSTAISVHAKIVKLLLSVYGHMQNHYLKILKKLPQNKTDEIVLETLGQVGNKLFMRSFQSEDLSTFNIDTCDVSYKLRDMTMSLKNCVSLEEVVSQVNMNLASTCSLLLALWSHVLETSCLNKQVRRELLSEYHKARVSRFQCSFFTIDNPRDDDFHDNRQQIYHWMSSEIRASQYYSDLPSLQFECAEADGEADSMPIVFEDVYTQSCNTAPNFPDRIPRNILARPSTAPPQLNEVTTVKPEKVQSSSDLSSRSVEVANEMPSASEPVVIKPQKKGIFKKRKTDASKERYDRLSVSDDETTKITLSEFLCTVGDKPEPSTVRNSEKSMPEDFSTAASSSAKFNRKSAKRRTKSKGSSSSDKSKRFHTLLTHRRSLDERAQRLVQLMKRNKRSHENKLSRSMSVSMLDNAHDSESTVSSHSSVHSDSYDDLHEHFALSKLNDDSALHEYYKTLSSSRLSGIALKNSRKEQNKFRMLLRSETFEEPEHSIQQKSLPSHEMNMIQCTVKNVTSEDVPQHKPMKVNTFAHDNRYLLGIPKAKSYSSGISALLDHNNLNTHDQEFPRPHGNYNSEIKTSQTVLGGLDSVWRGMGFHPGGTTLTTSDLSPFDEPELSGQWQSEVKDLISSSESAQESFEENLEDTVVSTEEANINCNVNRTITPTLSIEAEEVFNESTTTITTHDTPHTVNKPDVLPQLTSDSAINVKDDSTEIQNSESRSIENDADISDDSTEFKNAYGDSSKIEHDSSVENGINMKSNYTSELASLSNEVFDLSVIDNDRDRSHSTRGFAGSLDVGEEDQPLFSESLFEQTQTNNGATTTDHSITKQPVNNSNTKDMVITRNGNASIGKYNLTNTIPTIRSQLEKRHVAEKSRLFGRLQFPGQCYSDIPHPINLHPYLSHKSTISNHTDYSNSCHLVVCVHGLGGNCNDLRLIRTYLQLALPTNTNISFLMSRSNQNDTYADIDTMTDRLANEIVEDVQYHFSSKQPHRISFVGHSLGCLLIRSVIGHEKLKHLRSRFHTFLSLSGPHLGTVFNNSALVNTGLWLIQKWKKSACLLQLACKDHADIRKTYLYKLSKKKGLEYFSNVLLVASAQDRYVPYHSARIEMCKQAFRDRTVGPAYQEMLNNIIKPVLVKNNVNLVRYHVVHWLPSTAANSMIGRAAHIAVVDSEVFLEKFFLVSALKYFV